MLRKEKKFVYLSLKNPKRSPAMLTFFHTHMLVTLLVAALLVTNAQVCNQLNKDSLILSPVGLIIKL